MAHGDLERIQRVIDYIEEHLSEELTLSQLGRTAYYSEYHFHRVFQSLVGDTVAEYIRKRRLAQAAYQVAHSDDKLLDIALGHGFQSHETFIRAFRKLFGCTPGEYRKRGVRTPPYRKVNVLQLRYNPYLGGIRMEYRIENKPAFQVIGFELRTSTRDGRNHREIPQFWQTYLQERMFERIPMRLRANERTVELGLCTDFDMQTGEFSYIIGMEAAAFEDVPAELVCRTFPAEQYAVFTTPAVRSEQFSSSIQQTWMTIFSEWLPHSDYEHSGGLEFELYDERSDSARNELVQMDIYISVKQRS